MNIFRPLLVTLCVFTVCVVMVTGHQQIYDDEDDDDEDYDYDKKEVVNPIRQEKFVQDREHVEEHLKDRAKVDLEGATPEEIEFHFFSSHDTDKDGQLDGLELLHAVEHGVIHQVDKISANSAFDESTKKSKMEQIYSRVTRTIDRIMEEDDQDSNGYLTYAEYANARIASRTLRAVKAVV